MLEWSPLEHGPAGPGPPASHAINQYGAAAAKAAAVAHPAAEDDPAAADDPALSKAGEQLRAACQAVGVDGF